MSSSVFSCICRQKRNIPAGIHFEKKHAVLYSTRSVVRRMPCASYQVSCCRHVMVLFYFPCDRSRGQSTISQSLRQLASALLTTRASSYKNGGLLSVGEKKSKRDRNHSATHTIPLLLLLVCVVRRGMPVRGVYERYQEGREYAQQKPVTTPHSSSFQRIV